MNLTHNNKQGRDYLGPVNTNITYTTDHTTNLLPQKQKEIPVNHIRSHSQTKNDSQSKFQSLHTIIDSLRYENQSMNAMVRTKNQQIVNLKAQLKNQGIGLQSNNPQNKVIRQIYHLNSFRQPTGEPQSLNSVQLDKAAYQIRVLTKQRDDLKKYCQQLQQQQNKTVTQIITQPIQSQIPNKIQTLPTQGNILSADSISRQEHKKIVDQYQQHIASMAGKLSTVHKLQLQNTQLTQQRANILKDFQGVRIQLINRIGYCEHIESDLRFLEQQLNKRGGINNVNHQGGPQGNVNIQGNADFQNILNKNVFLQGEVAKLQKTLAEKQEKLTEIQLRGSGYVQVTKQAFESMQKNITTLQEKVNIANQGQRKQAEKYTNIQIELNKVNRQLAEKTRKTEVDGEQVKKLESQRNQNSSNLAKAKSQLKQMEKKYQDKSYQVQKLTADLEKSKKLSTLTQDYIMEVQLQKKRVKQSDELVKKMVQRVSSIQQNYRKVLRQNQKATQFVQDSKKKWQKYQKIIKDQNDHINTLNDRNSKRLQELDVNIKNGLNLQQKLRQLTRRNQSLTDQIEQCIKQNYYVRTPDTY